MQACIVHLKLPYDYLLAHKRRLASHREPSVLRWAVCGRLELRGCQIALKTGRGCGVCTQKTVPRHFGTRQKLSGSSFISHLLEAR